MTRGRFRALVLCYHAISDGWPHALAVGPRELEALLTRLLRRSRPIAVDAAARGEAGLHVTFDDAFCSIATALPVLARLGLPATVFACPKFVGVPLAVPELEASVRDHPDELRTMSWDDLRGLLEHGVAVESHTISHPHLPQLGDAELQRELRDSKAALEDELARPCRYLAYPFGDEDARVRAAAAAAGYEAAFALPGREDVIDRYALPRVGIYRGDSRLRLALKTAGPLRRAAAAALRAAGRR